MAVVVAAMAYVHYDMIGSSIDPPRALQLNRSNPMLVARGTSAAACNRMDKWVAVMAIALTIAFAALTLAYSHAVIRQRPGRRKSQPNCN